jgi:hypothetical protein
MHEWAGQKEKGEDEQAQVEEEKETAQNEHEGF